MLQYLTSLLARGARLEAGAALAYAVHVGMDYRVKSGQSAALLCSIFVDFIKMADPRDWVDAVARTAKTKVF